MANDDHPVREVLEKVVSDSAINAEQVRLLEEYVRGDWVIDLPEAKMLFRVNHAIGHGGECDEWTHFFIRSINRCVVMDLDSTGHIDKAEGDWLAEMLDEYGVENDTQRKFIFDLQRTTERIEGKLGEVIQSFAKSPFVERE